MNPPTAPTGPAPLVTDYFAERVLLPGGWADDVRLSVDTDGLLTEVRAGADPAGATALEGVVVPGIPNLHSHAFQRAMSGLTERRGPGRDTFWSWRERMYAFLERLGPDEVEAVATWLYVEMLRAGYTAVAEFHYLHHDVGGRPYADPAELSRRILRAARRTGIALTHLPVLYVSGDFGGAPPAPGQARFVQGPDGFLRLVERLRSDGAERPLVRVGIALHSLRAVPPGPLADVVDGARAADPGVPVHIHVAEQRREVEACLAWSGARPVAWLLDRAPVDGRWCLVHATHLDEGETAALAASGAVAGLCPTTEANLGDGLFPLRPYLEAGGSLGIGSDSHVSVSPVEELRWLEYGQRLVREERAVAAGLDHASTGRTLLEAALQGGRSALGQPVGALAAGLRADFLVLDPEHPTLVGRTGDDLLDAWIFAGNDSPVRHVHVAGRRVVEDGRHPEQEAARDAYRAAVRRILA